MFLSSDHSRKFGSARSCSGEPFNLTVCFGDLRSAGQKLREYTGRKKDDLSLHFATSLPNAREPNTTSFTERPPTGSHKSSVIEATDNRMAEEGLWSIFPIRYPDCPCSKVGSGLNASGIASKRLKRAPLKIPFERKETGVRQYKPHPDTPTEQWEPYKPHEFQVCHCHV